MHNRFATAFALTAAALFTGCGKQPPSTSAPDAGDAAPASSDADAPGGAADEAAADDGPEVKCLGINECSGQSACDVAGSHDCGGQNGCKGKGWILVSQGECEQKGGQVL